MKYQLFGHTGLRVSELCLGTMGFGTEWGWGADEATSRQVFETYANEGGNFIDTANRYTEGTSEKFVGLFTQDDRDHFVIATKYTLKDRNGDPNYAGNHRKNMMRSVQESLKRMNTDYIDLLWLHIWDFTTHPEEILLAMNDLISRGMVHYIGISDTPAWRVAQANTMAELRGWNRFAGLQVEYNLINRTAERDLLPVAKALNLALTPWAPLAGGALTGKYLKGEKGRLTEASKRLNERSVSIAKKVVAVAKELGCTPAQVAIRWTMQRDQTIIPIIGSTKAHQLTDALGAAQIYIPENLIIELNEVSDFELGFPHDFFNEPGVIDVTYGQTKDEIIMRP
ncbi:MAG: aldo/keto reductase [Bacteroidia bacterium]|nr:aldo/keto reductase [Bacteroidia bacterium]MCF8425316.1 aldo/keto reductase [Bacteroidia bacterium]MCF8446107.1 aldo/keto reductase [Bacteroidia bacterium]